MPSGTGFTTTTRTIPSTHSRLCFQTHHLLRVVLSLCHSSKGHCWLGWAPCLRSSSWSFSSGWRHRPPSSPTSSKIRTSTTPSVAVVATVLFLLPFSDGPAQRTACPDRLIEALLTRKFEELEPADFFVIMPLCPPERQQQIMAHLYRIRYVYVSIRFECSCPSLAVLMVVTCYFEYTRAGNSWTAFRCSN